MWGGGGGSETTLYIFCVWLGKQPLCIKQPWVSHGSFPFPTCVYTSPLIVTVVMTQKLVVVIGIWAQGGGGGGWGS